MGVGQHACLCTTCMQCPQWPEEGIPWSWSYKQELPLGFRELNLGPQQEHQMLLTTEPSPQSPGATFEMTQDPRMNKTKVPVVN